LNVRTTILVVAVLFVVLFGRQFFHQVPVGHVGVASFFGEVVEPAYPEGPHFPVNPIYRWKDFDVRQQTVKITQVEVPTRDQLLTRMDLSVQYRLDGAKVASIYKETGDEERVVAVHLMPKIRSLVRELGTKVERAEDFFKEETRDWLALELQQRLSQYVAKKGIIVEDVLVRAINLPPVLADAIEKKKEREQAVERQKAELERFRTEQQQQVAAAAAAREAAEEEAKRKRILADAEAYQITVINNAIQKNPAYIQLQALEALKSMSKDPAAKLYFLDADSPNPLPLMHMGDTPGR
jgi:regulator of protease activity HflC (stomatin/prohibitin superfamily)